MNNSCNYKELACAVTHQVYQEEMLVGNEKALRGKKHEMI